MRAVLHLIVGLAPLCGCIVEGEVPTYPHADDVALADDFAALCVEGHWDAAVGCALACGPENSTLDLADDIKRFVAPGTAWSADLGQSPFRATRGTVSWRSCQTHRYGGVVCQARARDYAITCGPGGISLQGPGAFVIDVPARALLDSPLPAMANGIVRGEAGGCLAACVAAATRAACDAGCGADEGCMTTLFGDVCHPPGAGAAQSLCDGPQDCTSLTCDGGRCAN